MADQSGEARVLSLLETIRGDLEMLLASRGPGPGGALPRDVAEAVRAAGQAHSGLADVAAWLRGAVRLDTPSPARFAASPHSMPSESASSGTFTAETLARVLRDAIEGCEALGEALEDDDPVVHFDAVQAIGLAAAVLGAAYQRLLRAGLAQPRPALLVGSAPHAGDTGADVPDL